MLKQVLAVGAIFAATLVANEKKEDVKPTETTTTTEVKVEETKKDAKVEHKDVNVEHKDAKVADTENKKPEEAK